MEDLIKRSDAIAAVWKPQVKPNELIFGALKTAIESEINNVPSADRPQGEVDAVEIYERAEHNLEQGYITIGEFDKRIEPLRHLCYGRPQGEWIEFDTKWGRSLYYCTNCMETSEVPTAFGKPLYNFCPNCGARMKGADNETAND